MKANEAHSSKTRNAMRALLDSAIPHDRLKAARYFLQHATSADYNDLRNALQKEDVRLIRIALADAMEFLVGDSGEDESEGSPQVDQEALRAASREVSSEIIHEAEPIIGLIDLYASREISGYELSNTKRAVERLKHLLSALKEMRRVARTPNISEVSVAALVREIIDEEGRDSGVRILSKVPSTLLVRTDPDILRVVLRNVVRNAIEATAVLDTEQKPPIVVDSNKNDRVWWVSVLDEGIGVKSMPGSAFLFGATSKSGHLGSGLATVKRAMDSLGGTAKLERTDRGGTRFFAEWPV